MVRNFEIIGEAAKHIPQKMRRKYPTVPWKQMAGTRDKLIHEYFGINKKVLWKTIKEDLMKIRPLIEQILREMENL